MNKSVLFTDILEPSLNIFAAHLYLSKKSDPLKKTTEIGK